MTKSTFLVFLLSLCFFPSLNAKPGKSPSIIGLWEKVGVKCNLEGQCESPIFGLFYYFNQQGKMFEGGSKSVRNGEGMCYEYTYTGNSLSLHLCKGEGRAMEELEHIEIEYKITFLDSRTILQSDEEVRWKLVRVK